MGRLLVTLFAAALILASAAGASRVSSVDAADAAWSPDGKLIAVDDAAAGQIVLMDASNGAHLHKVYESSDACCVGVSWASRSRLVFVDDYRVQTFDLATRKLTTITTDSEVYALSPDGKTVAAKVGCDCGHSPDSISVSSIDGRRRRAIPRPAGATDSAPAFSADGKWVTFTRSPFGGKGAPVAMAAPVTGGDPVPVHDAGIPGVASVPRTAQTVRWSPDGRWIAFTDARGALQLIRTSGGNPRLLDRYAGAPFTWSPDSKRIAYGPTPGPLTTVDLRGHRIDLWRGKPVYVTENSEDAPSWSPDGKWLVFPGLATNSGRVAVYVVRATGGRLRRLA